MRRKDCLQVLVDFAEVELGRILDRARRTEEGEEVRVEVGEELGLLDVLSV